MGRYPIILGYFVAVLPVALISCSSSEAKRTLNGSGSTVAHLPMARWARQFEAAKGTKVNYASIGSRSALQQFANKKTDFVCLDSPLTEAELKEMGADEIVQIPMFLDVVVIVHNIPELAKPLRLDEKQLAGIFLGKIRTWHDVALQSSNPGQTFPKRDIEVVYFGFPAAPTHTFTAFLSEVSDEWRNKIGSGLEVKWPIGVGGKGGEGPEGIIKQTPGAIGYLRQSAARNLGIDACAIRNKAGKFVHASTATIKASEGRVDSIVENAYPITNTVFLVYRKNLEPEKRKSLVEFVSWSIGDGQTGLEDVGCTPLSDALRKQAEHKIKEPRDSL